MQATRSVTSRARTEGLVRSARPVGAGETRLGNCRGQFQGRTRDAQDSGAAKLEIWQVKLIAVLFNYLKTMR